MLLLYSLGLGIPFVVGAVLLDRLKGAFGWLKRHAKSINLGRRRVPGPRRRSDGVRIRLGRLVSLSHGQVLICSRARKSARKAAGRFPIPRFFTRR
jgi:hypothetical protein